MSVWPVSPGAGRIEKARRAPSGLIAGSVSFSGPDVIATKRTEDDDGSTGVGRDASANTTALSTPARTIEATATKRFDFWIGTTSTASSAARPSPVRLKPDTTGEVVEAAIASGS